MINDYYEYINSFTYNGQNSLDFGLMVESKENVYGSASPIVETVSVPGRGTLILNNKADPLDNEEYEDIGISFTCCVIPEDGQDLHILARKIYAWLYSRIEFQVLTDTYEPNYYRLGYCREQASVEDIARALAGRIKITFTCRAFKRAAVGDTEITVESSGTEIYNHEKFTALPLVTVYGSGDVVLYFNQRQISINDIDGYITLDSENLNAYKGNANQNSKLVSQYFPKLVSGMNTVSWTGSVTKVEIIPRWVSL